MTDTAELPLFSPTAERITAPAFGSFFRLLVVAFILGLTGWGWRLSLELGGLSQLNRDALAWGIAGYALVAYMGIVMCRSQVTLTRDTLSQTWFWPRSTPLARVSYAKFIHIKGWEWLFAPRLCIRSGPGPFVTYHAASPAMWVEFQRWSDLYSAHPPR